MEIHRRRNEVFDLILTEYDEQAHIKKEKDWSRQEGRIEGKQEGLIEGIAEGITVGKEQLLKEYQL